MGGSLLDKLAKALEILSTDVENINEKLAGIVTSRWGKILPRYKLSSILEKYNHPGNYTTLFRVKVNKEAWSKLSNEKKQHDMGLANLQQTLQKVAVIVLKTSDYLLANTDHNSNATP